jgi:hypothetical protein
MGLSGKEIMVIARAMLRRRAPSGDVCIIIGSLFDEEGRQGVWLTTFHSNRTCIRTLNLSMPLYAQRGLGSYLR